MTLPEEINDFMFAVLYSDGTPLDLKRQAHDLINHFGLTFESDPKSDERLFTITSQPTGLSTNLTLEQYQRCKQHLPGQKINAIKELRVITNWGLREAKDAVDDISQWERE